MKSKLPSCRKCLSKLMIISLVATNPWRWHYNSPPNLFVLMFGYVYILSLLLSPNPFYCIYGCFFHIVYWLVTFIFSCSTFSLRTFCVWHTIIVTFIIKVAMNLQWNYFHLTIYVSSVLDVKKTWLCGLDSRYITHENFGVLR